MQFNTETATRLEVLAANSHCGARVRLAFVNDHKAAQTRDAFCPKIVFDVLPHTVYDLSYEGCTESFAYLYCPQTVLQEGIRVLSPAIETTANPYREQFHLTPPTGWLNDPNGLCFFGGLYHLYYQFYPHTQAWGNMHWGHAVSENLVDWRDMPVFLTPQQSLLEDSTLAGGAFSGSAVVMQDGIRFYLTRHSAPRDRECEMVETQVMLHSATGLEAGRETVILERTNPRHSYHFRDPKVFLHEDVWYMVLGSCIDGVPAVLLYTSQDGIAWHENGEVITVTQSGCESVECPDLFTLGDRAVCVAAHMNRTDASGRKNPVHYTVGRFAQGHFSAEHEGLYDFGGNFYAVQSFWDGTRRIAIGWVADFYAEHRCHPRGVYGSMTLPRVLSLQDGVLYQRPAPETETLKEDLLYSGAGDSVQLQVPGNAYCAQLECLPDMRCELLLARDGADTLRLICDQHGVRLLSTRVPQAVFSAPCGVVTSLQIFFDRRVAEIFINDGQVAGTKTFYCESTDGVFALAAQSPACIKALHVWSMRAIRG